VVACSSQVQAVASDYSSRNGGPTPLPACDDSAGPDLNSCYKTPYPGSGAYGVQVRIKRDVPFGFAKVVGLSSGTVRAKAAAVLSLPGGADAVSPVAVRKDIVSSFCNPSSCAGTTTTLNFDNSGYALLDLATRSTSPVAGGNVDTTTFGTWISTGYPGDLPLPMWYGPEGDNGFHNGLKTSFHDDGKTVLLVPVFDTSGPCSTGTCASPDPTYGAYYVIGFGAFVIDKNGVTWNNGKGNGHTLTGHFVRYIATGVGGGGGTDFGVHVLTLNE